MTHYDVLLSQALSTAYSKSFLHLGNEVIGHFKLSGADNPGIVHKLTSVLARNSLTIAYMKTRQDEAPFGGTELFTMEGKAVAYLPLASHFDHKQIGGELNELGESLNCDVEFSDVSGSSL